MDVYRFNVEMLLNIIMPLSDVLHYFQSSLQKLNTEIYQEDALSMGINNGVKPSNMPLTLSDSSYDLRDHFFTPPYPHPSCTL